MKTLRCAALPLFGAFLCICQARAQSLNDVFSALDEGAHKFKSMLASVKDDDYTALVNDHSVQSGKIKVKKEAAATLMLLDFTGPAAKSISLDASTVKIFNPKANVVQVYDIGNRRSLIDQYLLLGFGATSDDLKKAYAITYVGAESISGQKAGNIQLIPKSPEQQRQLQKVNLWISTSLGIPVQQKFWTGTAGDYKELTYSEVKLNPSFSDKDLQLKTPKGVQIEHVEH
jgi:outer membrane lipoprotein-sorting protein